MKLLTYSLILSLTLFLISCGGTTKTSSLVDIKSISIDSSDIKIYSTQLSTQLSATVTYQDNTTADATKSVDWISSDTNVSTVAYGVVYPGLSNGGDANISIAYKDFNDSISVGVIKLMDYNITHADINATGSYTLEATGYFEDNTSQIIHRNIYWLADNSAIITLENDIYTITVIAGDTNVTAVVFNELNSTATTLAPKTITYSIN
ncbi:hypothetical protein GJV85_01500 [Sulfurimonas aquatica]|uniref:BIG2 domain-containing protein n=1 Tax=Sulfurimonas aquatica TaxID=2672570 RepID=A0A975AYF0_9BACT|nr:hypothetical protein [Sulfurimonas aquatica]QSZ40844.1 hypothetical protein GJV85_01500 [Sulfurimonas aquatica]